jgi:F-type H+-transporting ATPase subunit b
MKKILLLLTLSTFLLSNGLEGTDYIPRAVNFLIFVSILYYILADKIRDAMSSRQSDIQNQLSAAQDKLAQSKKQKQQSISKVTESQKMAKDIIKTAEDECKSISKKYKEQTKNNISSLKKSYEDKMSMQLRQVKIDVTKDILDSFVDDSLDSLTKEKMINIISKKVA